jgi:hypothetical protein
MTPTDPTAPAPTTPPPAAAEPVADLLAESTAEECLEEWVRYHDDRKADRLSFEGIPEGHHVAYFGGQIIDHDADYMALCARAAAKAGVHRARLVMDYPWMMWQEEIARNATAARQHDALVRLNDELMSILQAPSLREERVPSAIVREWLRGLLGFVEEGLGKNRSSQ